MAGTAKASQTARPRLLDAVRARRSPEQQQSAKKFVWTELFWSLWAPLCIFGIVFLPYIALIELVDGAWVWAQPLLKGFGFLMVLYFVALLVLRAVPFPAKSKYQARRDTHDQLVEIDRVVERAGHHLENGPREKLIEQSVKTDAAWISGDEQAMHTESEVLAQLADKTLAPWRKQGAMDFTSGLFKALAIALLIRTVFIEPFKIPSGSMIPTLEIGDQVFVNKFIYGVRIPFTNYVPFQIVRAPKRGDVIVFNNPVRPSDDYIKRVVGIGGDRIEMKDQVLFINGEEQPRELLDPNYLISQKDGDEWVQQYQRHYRENLSGHLHSVLQSPHAIDADQDFGPYTVPEDHVFVLGDNRNNSSDSRYGLGEGSGLAWQVEYVPLGNIKGKAMVIWMALGHEGFLSHFFGGTGLRTDRLFLPVR